MSFLDQWDILLPAFLAGLLVLSTHIPLGETVLKRGIIFLDLAVAQLAGLGLMVAYALGWGDTMGHSHAHHSDEHALRVFWEEYGGVLLSQCLACGMAIIGVTLLYRVRHASARVQEALIGIVFMLSATGSVLLLANDPHGGEHLKELLVGQILWVNYSQLAIVAVVYAALFLVLSLPWVRQRSSAHVWMFYAVFAVAITLSTQLVGVYLVFASLIVPALACSNNSRPRLSAWIVGTVAYALGLVLSAVWDLPSGAVIAWCLVMVALVAYVFNQLTSKEHE